VECGTGSCVANSTCGPPGYDPTDCVTPNGLILLHGLEQVGAPRQANWIYDCSGATASGSSSYTVTVSSNGLPTGNTNLIAVTLTTDSSSTSDPSNGVSTTPTHAKFDLVINPVWTTTGSKLALIARIDHVPLSSNFGSATISQPTSAEGGNEKELICTDPACNAYYKWSQCWTTGVAGVAATACAPADAGQCSTVTPGCFQIIRSLISVSTDTMDGMERDANEISDVVSFTFDTTTQPAQIVWDPTVAGPNGMDPSGAVSIAPFAAILVVLALLV